MITEVEFTVQLIRQMEETIREFSLLQSREHIIVGVSGGPDSLALLHGLNTLSPTYGWRLTAVHVHHQLRGGEADADARFVASFCREHHISYEVRQVNVRQYLDQYGGNLQDVARKLRYEAFADVADKLGVTKLALGHHADDQAETVLMRFLRGAGTRGLAGIPVKRQSGRLQIVRPLWRVWRRDIERYCDEFRLNPRHDSSNESSDYLRNHIRLELIPKLQQYNPQLKLGMLQLSEQLAAEEEMWKKWTRVALERVLEGQGPTQWTLSISEFHALSLALQRRVIQLILSYLSIHSWAHTESVRQLTNHASPSARCSLPHGWVAERDYSLLHIRKRETTAPAEDGYYVQLQIPGETYIPLNGGARFETVVTRKELETAQRGMPWAVFDLRKLAGRVIVRTRQPGDRIHIVGMDGTKKVKDLFIDEKISRDKRNSWPLVADESGILWIPGLRRSNRALVTAETEQRLYVFYRRGNT